MVSSGCTLVEKEIESERARERGKRYVVFKLFVAVEIVIRILVEII